MNNGRMSMIKRRLAVLLILILGIQPTLTSAAAIPEAGAARETYGGTFSLTGKPSEAFKELTVKFSEKLGPNSTLDLRVDGALDDAYLQDTFQAFLDQETSYYEIDFDENLDGIADSYRDYDAYLEAQNDPQKGLPEISFSFDVSNKYLGLASTGDIVTTDGDVIGTYTIGGDDGKATVTGTFRRMVYNRSDLKFGQNMSLELTQTFEADTTVTVKNGTGDNNFTATINGEPSADIQNSGYTIAKGYDESKKDDDTTIVYTLTVTASTQNLVQLLLAKEASASAASGSEATASEASGSEATAGQAIAEEEEEGEDEEEEEEAEEEDEEFAPQFDEENQEEGYHGPELMRLLEKMLPPTDRRLTAGYREGSSSEIVPLSGTYITDQIPEGLTLVSVEARYGGKTISGDFAKLTDTGDSSPGAGQYSYQEDSRELKIVLPDHVFDENDKTEDDSAEYRITTRLSDAAYNEYMLSGKEFKKTFPNKAMLRGAEDQLLAVSDRAEPKIELGFPFVKDGGFVDSTMKELEWTLNVNSNFSRNVTLYAVDHIEDVENTHNYEVGTDVTIKGAAGGVESTKEIKTLGGGAEVAIVSADYAYDKITNISTIRQLFEAYEMDIGDWNTPIVYQYPAGNGRNDAVMLIPLTDYANKELNITYRTKVQLDESDFGQSGTEETPSGEDGNISRKLKNEAKILWKWPEGQGPGPLEEFGSATIGKGYDAEYNLVKKSGVYNETTNTIRWNFLLNQFGTEMQSIDLTDTFTDSELLLLGVGEGKTIPLKKYNHGEETPGAEPGTPVDTVNVPWVLESPAEDKWYYRTEKSEDGKTLFTLHLSDVKSTDYYSFDLETFVNNVDLVGTENDVNVKNTADVSAVISDKPVKFETSASCPVKTTLIRKDAIAFDEGELTGGEPAKTGWYYNYADNTVKWRVTVNPRGWTIEKPELLDILPDGVEFNESCELTKVTYGGEKLKIKDLSQTGGSGWQAADETHGFTVSLLEKSTATEDSGDDSGREQMVFTFSANSAGGTVSIGEPMTFEFTTYVKEEHRRTVFQSNKKDTLTNKATFSGNVKNDREEASFVTFSASDTADNTYKPSPMMKEGQYSHATEYEGSIEDAVNPVVDYVSWELYVNRTRADMGGAVVTDNIAECMELIPGSMKVFTVELDEKGEEKKTQTVDITDILPNGTWEKAPAFDGFKFKILSTEEYKSKTLKFTFDTVMVDDALANEINNSVSIAGTGFSDQTDSAQAEQAQNFKLDSYATAKNLYFTRIYKTSEHESTRFPLQGAEFEIQEMAEPGSGEERTDIGNWKPEAAEAAKVRTSTKRGTVNFMFLKPDTMYQITETAAPIGYTKSGCKWYVVPCFVSKKESDFPGEILDEEDNQIHINKTEKHYLALTIKNSVDEGKASGNLSFKKTGQNGQILSGVTFTASNQRLQKLDEAISDDNGTVTFNSLDPLMSDRDYYTIQETPPAGYKAAPPMYAYVYIEDGKVESKFRTDSYFTKETVGGKAINVLSNAPITQSGSFKKVDQNSDPLVATKVTFNVGRRGDGGQILSKEETDPEKIQVCIDVDQDSRVIDKSEYKSYKLCPTLTGKGTISFKNFLYGDYKLEEVKPENLADGASAATFYIRINENGAFAFSSDPSTSGETGTPLSEMDPVVNEMKYGFVQVNKVIGERDGEGKLVAAQNRKGIPGIKFNIYRDLDGDKTLDAEDKNSRVMTLTTDASGKFPVESGKERTYDLNGKEKQLIFGNYILQEQPSSDYDVPQNKYYAFTLNEEATFYVDSQATEASGVLSKNSKTYFLNAPKRGTVTLKKADKDYPEVLLWNAKFDVYTRDSKTKVATLKEDGKARGNYVLKPLSGSEPADTDGKKYVEKLPSDSGGETYALLYGKYYLVETEPPSLPSPASPANIYEAPAGKQFNFTVNSSAVTVLDTNGNITNTAVKYPVKIHKLVEQVTAAGNTSEFGSYIDGAGFTFTLMSDEEHPGPVNMPEEKTFSLEKRTPMNPTKPEERGMADFGDVAPGVYVLKETGIPKKYGTLEKPYIERMPDIKVTVTAAGVEYAIDSTDEIILEETRDDIYNVRVDGEDGAVTKNDQTLIVRNNFQFGSASGTKQGVFNGGTIPLGGATFTLTGENVSGELCVVSEADTGKIIFNHIPFGDYELKETASPKGYQKKAETNVTKVKIDRTGVLLSSQDGIIKNDPILKELKFAKVDQNGDPLGSAIENITFNVTRDGPDEVILPANLTSQKTAKLALDGTVQIENLAYGTYTVTEAEPSDPAASKLDPKGKKASFTIKVEKDSSEGVSGQTKVTLTMPGADGTASGESVSLSSPDTNVTVCDFSNKADTDHYFPVRNELRYGLADIHKVAADDEAGGTLKPLRGTPLENVVFKVYEDKNRDGELTQVTGSEADESNAVLTLVTGVDGSFKKNSDHQYLYPDADGKLQPQPYRLVYGKAYLLREEALPGNLADKYQADPNCYPFTIADEVTGSDDGPLTYYIGTAKESGVVIAGKTAAANEGQDAGNKGDINVSYDSDGAKLLFPNQPLIRGTVEIDKTDAETEDPVKGAQFDIYLNTPGAGADPVKVAALSDWNGTENDGTYRLKPGTGDGYTKLNPSGQEYVKEQSDGTYQLLGGSYYIKETNAPLGYVRPEDKPEEYWYFDLKARTADARSAQSIGITNEDLIGADGEQVKPFINTLSRSKVVVKKQTERFGKGDFHAAEKAEGTFTFRLKGRAFNQKEGTPDLDQSVTLNAAAGESGGTVTFGDILAGSYTLSEEIPEDSRYRSQPDIEIRIDADGVHYGENAEQDGRQGIEIRNSLKRGSIKAEKLTRDGAGELPLEGAKFELKALDGIFKDTVVTAVSDSGGAVEFTDLPLGTYGLTEVSAPSGYEISGRRAVITVETDGQKVIEGQFAGEKGEETGEETDEETGEETGGETDTLKPLTFMNDAYGTISIEKQAEVLTDNTLTGTVKPGEGFLFKITGTSADGKRAEEFVKESDILGASKVEIRDGNSAGENGVYAVTDAAGRLVIRHMPAGTYQVREAENEKNDAAGAYVPDTKVYGADVRIDRTTEAVISPEIAVTNRLKRGAIEGIKTKADKATPLEGATIGLFPAGVTEYTEETLYAGRKTVSREDGTFRFEQIPYGRYQVRELQAPNGYLLNTDTIYLVEVTEDGVTVTQGIDAKAAAAGNTAGDESGEAAPDAGPDGQPAPAPILITNERRASNEHIKGGGSPNTSKKTPSGPGPGTTVEPEVPANPETPQYPELPVQPEEGGKVGLTPPGTQPGTEVVIRRANDQETVYMGKTGEDGSVHVVLPPGDYILTTIDDNQVPLANMLFTIEDPTVPMAGFPDVGDHAIPIQLLAVLLFSFLGGLGILLKKKKEILEGKENESE